MEFYYLSFGALVIMLIALIFDRKWRKEDMATMKKRIADQEVLLSIYRGKEERKKDVESIPESNS